MSVGCNSWKSMNIYFSLLMLFSSCSVVFVSSKLYVYGLTSHPGCLLRNLLRALSIQRRKGVWVCVSARAFKQFCLNSVYLICVSDYYVVYSSVRVKKSVILESARSAGGPVSRGWWWLVTLMMIWSANTSYPQGAATAEITMFFFSYSTI